MLCALVKMRNFLLFGKSSHKSGRLASLFCVCLMFCRRNVDSKVRSSAFFVTFIASEVEHFAGSHVSSRFSGSSFRPGVVISVTSWLRSFVLLSFRLRPIY